MDKGMVFGAIASQYDLIRPPVPQTVVAWLTENGPFGTVVDVGAGTGLFTRMLIDGYRTVIAVEPDSRMRRILRQSIPDACCLNGVAEQLPLEDSSVDAVFLSGVWHWVDPFFAAREIARVLRPGGRLGVVWNIPDSGRAWMADIFRIIGRQHDRPPGLFDLPAETVFCGLETYVHSWEWTVSPGEFPVLLDTYSHVLTQSSADQVTIRHAVDDYMVKHPDLVDHHGQIAVPFRTVAYRTAKMS